MDFEISKRHVGAAVALGIVIGVLQFNCETQQAHDEHPEAEAVAELTPSQRIAELEAVGLVRRAHDDAIDASLREVNQKLTVLEKQREKKAPSPDETDVVTITFRANNHGEREDCGCKNNPLGGLARHQTLVELASEEPTDEAKKWWGDDIVAADTWFNVDAGDLFFRRATEDIQPIGLQKKAREHAKAVAGALKASPPDAANVGEIDLVFGLDTYKKLVSSADLPVVSANLYTKDGKRPFDGHRVVSRGGKKVAFIGLLKPKGRIYKFYESRQLDVRPPKEAYLEELARVPEDVDLVVLLSNLGVNETTELVTALKEEGARIDAGIVSNTNRLTRSPVWAAGVPLVEPLSRGKYFGRLDLRLGKEKGVSFANAMADPKSVVQEYRRAWSAHYSAREQWRRTALQIAELEKDLEEQREVVSNANKKPDQKEGNKEAKAASAEKAKEAKRRIKQIESRIEFLEKKLPTLEKRLETASSDLASKNAKLGSLDELVRIGEGDDWATSHIVQVKVEMPEDKKVRRALDRFAKN